MKRVILLLFVISYLMLTANLLPTEAKQSKNEILRQATDVFDIQKNTVSNFEFYSFNNGIIEGGTWPRGSQNQYMYGSGFCFGAEKQAPDNSGIKNYIELSYNPNNGRSWFVPGRIEDGDNIDSTKKDKYRVYFSTDFNKTNGVPIITSDGPNWPFWIMDSTTRFQNGAYKDSYIYNENLRNLNTIPLGPMYVSHEDIVSTFKDADLSFYDSIQNFRRTQGYPMRLQVESKIYTWGDIDREDIILISYLIQNKSNDTLMNCWFGGIYDVDIGRIPTTNSNNDRANYFQDDPNLNLAFSWTESNYDPNEKNKGFGYIGVSLIESPAVDVNGYIRKEKNIYPLTEQIGLRTYRNWSLYEDIAQDDSLYRYLTSKLFDGDAGAGDKRMLLGTGPFNMLPGDTARIALCIALAMPAKGGEADGTNEDLTGLSSDNSLVGKIKRAFQNYYEYVPLSVNDNTIETGIALSSVYPNPVSNLASIKYHLSNVGNIRLALYNQLGQEVALIREGYEEAGDYNRTFSFEKNKINDGLYFLRLQSGSQTLTKEIVVVH